MKPAFVALIAAAAALASPGAAGQTAVDLPAFEQIELRGGGRVVVRHGAVQQVRLLRGSRDVTALEVDDDGRLTITACRSRCRDYRLEIEVVTPRIAALSIRGGGEIETSGAFPAQQSIAAAVTGGGELDVRALGGISVAAAVTGGGSILTAPESSLAASVRGGGTVRYWGNAAVVQAVSGGGSVEQVSRR